MRPIVELVIGVLLISGSVTYGLWTIIRVLQLRQDIYDLRDFLFDEAQKIGALGDPAYRDLRNTLNGLARIADRVSVPATVYLFLQDPPSGSAASARRESSREDVERLVQSVYTRLTNRLARYLFLETAAGWMILLSLVFALLPLVLSRALFKPFFAKTRQQAQSMVRAKLPSLVATS
jgi:hypothetical protein